jgi:hypothetical protein
MCGLCGAAGHTDAETLRRMTATLTHRGPDDAGRFEAPGIALGVRRLSIIDVPGGHQPIANEDGSVTVVFNGEIYNSEQQLSCLRVRRRVRGAWCVVFSGEALDRRLRMRQSAHYDGRAGAGSRCAAAATTSRASPNAASASSRGGSLISPG